MGGARTEQRLKDEEHYLLILAVKDAVLRLNARLDARFDRIDARFDRLDACLDRLIAIVERIEPRNDRARAGSASTQSDSDQRGRTWSIFSLN
jgi:hypothetical protein